MIPVALSIAVALLIVINLSISIKYLSMRSKYLQQKQEAKMYRNMFEESQRKIREEANKNIILQSLVNQRAK